MAASEYPLLSAIDSPADLRRLPVETLPQLAAEMRRYLIDTLCQNPGHFASSMGAVDLTIALHYVFDTPDDRIVWDVGHQAYGHKLLTGRRDAFHTLRTLGGISGFPTPAESPYDTFTAGHASNSISAALGMAVAAQQQGSPRKVVAVIGDASISGGLAFEALNNAANAKSDILIILNDNNMSIDDNVGSLHSYLGHITTSPTYNNLRDRTYRTLKRMHIVGDGARGPIMRFNNSLKALLTHEQNIFEGLNIRYLGPFDGHNIATMVRVLRDIKEMRGPRLLHLRTVKGRGFAAAEADPARWHAPGLFNPLTGEKPHDDTPRPPKYQDVFGDTLVELARRDPRVVGITAAMLSGTSMSKMQKAFPERTFDVGISEGHAVTFAGGLAKEGMRPFVAIYSSFLQRAYDNIIHDTAIQGLHVTYCIDRAGIVGEDGVTHHGLYDLAYLRPIPGLTIAAPRNLHMLRRLMASALTGADTLPGPMAIRYPRGRGDTTEWQCPLDPVEVGRAVELRPGSDAAILCLGPLADNALQAAEQAAVELGKQVAVYDMVFLKPLDTALLDTLIASGTPLVTLEDGTLNGGLGSAVAEYLAERGATAPLTRLGIADRFVHHGTPEQLYRLNGLDPAGILAALR